MSNTLSLHQLSLNHLLAELDRINVLVQYCLHCYQTPTQNLPLSIETNEDETFVNLLEEAKKEIETTLSQGKKQTTVSRLQYLQTVFNLSNFELDIFLIALAPILNVKLEKTYGTLQDDLTRTRASVDLALTVMGLSTVQKLLHLPYFQAESSLFKHHLLEKGSLNHSHTINNSPLNYLLWPSQTVVAWLLGYYQPEEALAPHITLGSPHNTPLNNLLIDDLLTDLWPLLEQTPPHQMPILALYGLDQNRQEAIAHLVADKMAYALLTVDLAAIINQKVNPYHALNLILRDAHLNLAIPYLKGWEACLINGAVPLKLLKTVCAYPQLLIISTKEEWLLKDIDRQRRFIWLETPAPSYQLRKKLWPAFIEKNNPNNNTNTPSSLNLTPLAAQFTLTTDQIRDAAALAQDRAYQHQTPLQLNDLFTASRLHSRPHLSDLARKITPRYGWDDLILPPSQTEILKEIVSTVRQRAKVLETWGAGRKLVASAAVAVLFAGSPGTGKTMAAEVIAGDLGFDLYKINLSSVVSKYIGETEKNLERIFEEAENSNTILFFDEADSIFGKRSEVRDSHDRHANTQVSYLLQRMESYNGVTILATNLRGNLDSAFTRRLNFMLQIPFPNATSRLQIWQTLFPPDVPKAKDIDLNVMAQRFELAGGNIRNIIVAATYLAAADGQEVTMAHLLHGTRRELQKMGRLINEKDMDLT